jgi:hypothetical protein
MNLIARLASKTHATPHMTLINFVRILRGEAHAVRDTRTQEQENKSKNMNKDPRTRSAIVHKSGSQESILN